MMLSGILYLSAMLLYLQALQSEEASVVAPFFQAGPLFGYVLAYLVLGETLTPRQMAGGALIIVGALFVSLRLRAERENVQGAAGDADAGLRLHHGA